ncbi:MAG: TolC family protein [Proteobacteria bacterium]|nr:TolC family protein [Pseudomonadota bacterium]
MLSCEQLHQQLCPSSSRSSTATRAAFAFTALGALFSACSTTAYERGAWQRINTAERRTPDPRPTQSAADRRGPPDPGTAGFDGSLAGYVAHAVQHNPSLRAAFEDWRAAVHSIARARRLPEPTLGYGVFLRRIETRVGPQRQRFSLRQMVPWPGVLTAAADAAAGAAAAAESRFEARGLAVRQGVAEAYWALWLVRRTRVIKREQRELLIQLAALVRSRIEVGRAQLADAAQIDLEVSRLDDVLAGLDQREERARATLIEIVGGSAEIPTPTSEKAPGPALPQADVASLRASARNHPEVLQHRAMAEASDHRVRRARAEGLPSVVLGVDYIETGEAATSAVEDSGKDAVAVSVAISLPLWRNSYRREADSAAARAAAARARRRAAENRADAEVDRVLADVRNSARRIDLYRKTLIPQGDTVYAAVIGAYQSGTSSLASALIAQKNALEMRIQHASAQAEHARAWARLEALAGHQITHEENP